MITDGVARYRPEHDVNLLTYGSFVDEFSSSRLSRVTELKFAGAPVDFARL